LKDIKNIKQVELLPFHRYGEGKYHGLGLDYPAADYTPPSGEILEDIKDIFEGAGLVVFVRD